MIKYQATGFAFGSRYSHEGSPEQQTKHLRKILKSEGKGAVNRILNTPRRVLAFWDKIGMVSEFAARVELFSVLQKVRSGRVS